MLPKPRFLRSALVRSGRTPRECGVMVSTQDMKAAYRQVPVHPENARFSVVAVYCPAMQAWRYGLLDGLAFGLTSAVLHFNRLPVLLRRSLGAGWPFQSPISLTTSKLPSPPNARARLMHPSWLLLALSGWSWTLISASCQALHAPFLGRRRTFPDSRSRAPLLFVPSLAV